MLYLYFHAQAMCLAELAEIYVGQNSIDLVGRSDIPLSYDKSVNIKRVIKTTTFRNTQKEQICRQNGRLCHECLKSGDLPGVQMN